jgi:hypothetical protein
MLDSFRAAPIVGNTVETPCLNFLDDGLEQVLDDADESIGALPAEQ